MQRNLRRVVFLSSFALVIAACSGDDASPSTTAPTTIAAPTTTTGVPPPDATTTPTTTSPPPETTTTNAEDETVGDMTQVHQEIEDLLETARNVATIADDAVAYLPDLSNADPVIALEEAWNFENWVISVDPHPDWLQFYLVPDSPYADETTSELDKWTTRGYRVEDFSDSYYFRDAKVVPLDSAVIPDDVRADLPRDTTAIINVYGAGERTVVDQDTGEVLDTWPAYGPRTCLTLIAPTKKGWRVYYSEPDYEG